MKSASPRCDQRSLWLSCWDRWLSLGGATHGPARWSQRTWARAIAAKLNLLLHRERSAAEFKGRKPCPWILPARVELRSLSAGGPAGSRPLQPQLAWESLSSAWARPPNLSQDAQNGKILSISAATKLPLPAPRLKDYAASAIRMFTPLWWQNINVNLRICRMYFHSLCQILFQSSSCRVYERGTCRSWHLLINQI